MIYFRSVKYRHQAGLVAGLLAVLVACAARVYGIIDVPPSLTGDEAANLIDIRRILQGDYLPFYFEANNGREPLFIYLQTPLAALLGLHPYALRLTSALVGILTVAVTYRLIRDLFGDLNGPAARWTPAVASLLLATSFWHITLSRIGLRAISLPLILTMALLLFWRGYSRNSRAYYLASGAVVGLSLYTYTASRLAPLILVAFLAGVLFCKRTMPRPNWKGVALGTLALCLVAAPLAIYAVEHPLLFWGRVSSVSTVSASDVSTASSWESLTRTLGMFVLKGNDQDTTFNPGARPVFDWPMGMVFLAGLVLAIFSLGASRLARFAPSWLRTIRPEASLLCLIWLVIMLTPSVFSFPAPHFLRAAGAAPVAYVFPALAVGIAAARLSLLPSRWWRHSGYLAIIALVLWSSGTGVWDYARLATSDWYYYELDSDVYEVSLYIKRRSEGQGPFIYGDAGLMSYGSIRSLGDGRAASFDSRWAVPFPNAETEYLFLSKDAPGRNFGQYLPATAEKISIKDSRGKETVSGHGINGNAALRYNRTDPSAPLYWANRRPVEPADGAGSIAGQMALRGYGVAYGEEALPAENGSLGPGQAFRVTLGWEVLSKPAQSYQISVKAFDSTGQVRAQRDSATGGGRYPTDRWRPGEWVYDMYELRLDAQAAPGGYDLEVTVYDLPTMRIMPVINADGRPLGQHYTLGPIIVE